jgi:hypothetical protein
VSFLILIMQSLLQYKIFFCIPFIFTVCWAFRILNPEENKSKIKGDFHIATNLLTRCTFCLGLRGNQSRWFRSIRESHFVSKRLSSIAIHQRHRGRELLYVKISMTYCFME